MKNPADGLIFPVKSADGEGLRCFFASGIVYFVHKLFKNHCQQMPVASVCAVVNAIPAAGEEK